MYSIHFLTHKYLQTTKKSPLTFCFIELFMQGHWVLYNTLVEAWNLVHFLRRKSRIKKIVMLSYLVEFFQEIWDSEIRNNDS